MKIEKTYIYLVFGAALFNFLFSSCVCIDPFDIKYKGKNPAECTTDDDCNIDEICKYGYCSPIENQCYYGQKRSCNPNPKDFKCISKGEQICKGGTWGPCKPLSNLVEFCNGKDDDCDGMIDESFPEIYKFCRIPHAFGPCSRGEYRKCIGGKLICETTYQRKEESVRAGTCDNGIDDDCDGYIDDPDRDECFSCKDGARRQCYPYGKGVSDPTVGVGICRAGVQECFKGRWGKCQGAVTPKKEICGNNQDDDCDGKIDNCPGSCTPGEKRACYSGPYNTKGIGACRAGIQICLSNGKWSNCRGEILPKPELCDDKVDNDCDGEIDECSPSVCSPGETRNCYTGPKNTAGIGICRMGTQVCTAKGEWPKECSGEVIPKRELCGNNRDDDCDGKVDNCSVTQFASSSWDKVKPVVLWDLKSARSIRAFTSGHSGTVYAIRFSPNGKEIYSADDSGIIIARDADTGKESWRANLSKPIYSMAVNGVRGYLAVGHGDGSISFISMKNGSILKGITAHSGSIFSLAISRDGKWLASSSVQGEVSIWDASGVPPKLRKKLSGFSLGVFSVVFSPRGDFLAAGGREGLVKVWSLPGLKVSSLPSRYPGINSLAFFYGVAKLAVGLSDGSIAIWKLSPSAKLDFTINGKGFGAVYSLLIWPDDKTILSGHYNNNIAVWDLANYKSPKYQLGLHSGPISSLAIRP